MKYQPSKRLIERTKTIVFLNFININPDFEWAFKPLYDRKQHRKPMIKKPY